MKTYLVNFYLLGHGKGSATFSKETDRENFLKMIREELVEYSLGVGDADGNLVGAFYRFKGMHSDHYE